MGELKLNSLFNIYKKYRTVNIVNPYIITSIPIVSDVDAQAFINAAIIKNVTTANVINQLCIGLKANNLWTKIPVCYPVAGDTAHAHKFNLKDPRDLDAAFRITWVSAGSGTHDSNGYTLVGTTDSYGNTHFAPSVNQNVNSNGVTISVGLTSSSSGIQIGSLISSTIGSTLQTIDPVNGAIYRFNSNAKVYVNSDGKGIYTAQRISSTVNNGWKLGVKKITSSATGSLSTIPFYIGALNNNSLPANNSNGRIQSVFIHEGLTDAEIVILHGLIDAFESGLSRKTW